MEARPHQQTRLCWVSVAGSTRLLPPTPKTYTVHSSTCDTLTTVSYHVSLSLLLSSSFSSHPPSHLLHSPAVFFFLLYRQLYHLHVHKGRENKCRSTVFLCAVCCCCLVETFPFLIKIKSALHQPSAAVSRFIADIPPRTQQPTKVFKSKYIFVAMPFTLNSRHLTPTFVADADFQLFLNNF